MSVYPTDISCSAVSDDRRKSSRLDADGDLIAIGHRILLLEQVWMLAARGFEAARWSVVTGHREDEEEHHRDVDEDVDLVSVGHSALL